MKRQNDFPALNGSPWSAYLMLWIRPIDYLRATQLGALADQISCALCPIEWASVPKLMGSKAILFSVNRSLDRSIDYDSFQS